ncbi:MAG: FAD-dependent oxidoreductase [Myxococcota bacterium]
MKKYDVIIIGAGPAGMAAAIQLRKDGVEKILVVERNPSTGGILNQCIHPGFGLYYYKEYLTGPEYATIMKDEFSKLQIPCLLETMVIDLDINKRITVSSKQHGIRQIAAEAIILATGCRERTRENIQIPGTRPAGIFTAGQAQNLINCRGYKLGKRVIIQGSGDIGLIMARRLTIEGYKVVRVLERLPWLSGLIRNKVQCLDDFEIPLELDCQISKIHGKERVTGITFENKQTSRKTRVQCDMVLFSVGLIPEIEILKKNHIIDDTIFSARVDSNFQTDLSGVFITGNALHIHDLADNASKEAENTAKKVKLYLDSPNKFEKELTSTLPYEIPEQNKDYDSNFFKKLDESGKKICILCPKGCLVNKQEWGCKRGKQFYLDEMNKKLRQFTTTINIIQNGKNIQIPVKTKENIPISWIRKLKAKLSKLDKRNKDNFTIDFKNRKINFITP